MVHMPRDTADFKGFSGTRTCRTCKLVLDVSRFYQKYVYRDSARDGRVRYRFADGHCKSCRGAKLKAKLKSRPADKVRADKVRLKAYARRYKYKMTVAEDAALFAHLGHVCHSCRMPDPGNRKHEAQVDHDHDTGRVRGLLCRFCNSWYGWRNDDPFAVFCVLLYALYHAEIAAGLREPSYIPDTPPAGAIAERMARLLNAIQGAAPQTEAAA
jgi:hypothetical protein